MSTINTITSAKAWSPDVHSLAPETAIPQSLLMQVTTRVGVIEGDEPMLRCPVLDLDDTAGFVAEGANIDEAEPQAGEIALGTGKIAALVKVSHEQLRQPEATAVIQRAIERAVSRKVDVALLSQPAPTAPAIWPPTGLLALATDGGEVTNSLDPVVDAVAVIEQGYGLASHVVASPSAWAALSKLKRADASNESLIGAGSSAAARSLLGLPVLVSNAVDDGKVIVLASNQVVSAYGDVRTAVSEDAYFGQDSVGIRATFRFGAGSVKKSAVVALTIA